MEPFRLHVFVCDRLRAEAVSRERLSRPRQSELWPWASFGDQAGRDLGPALTLFQGDTQSFALHIE